MPCIRKPVKRGKQPALDDLEVLRLQGIQRGRLQHALHAYHLTSTTAITKTPSQVRLKWDTKSWDDAPRFQLRMRRKSADVYVGNGLHDREMGTNSRKMYKLSKKRLTVR